MFASICSFTKNDPLCMAYHPYHFVGEVLLHPVYSIMNQIRVFCPRASLSLQSQAPWLQFCRSAGLQPQTQDPRLQFYCGFIGAVTSRCFPHPTLSSTSEQILKYPRAPRGG